MSSAPEASYGSWASPITSDVITQASVGLSQPAIDGDSSYWLEGRPLEKGRTVLVRRRLSDGAVEDLTPPPYNVRTLAHEYGGGAYSVKADLIFFVNFSDQRIYQVKPSGITAVTAAGEYHYADIYIDQPNNRLICVREDHTVKGKDAVTTIVAVSLSDGLQKILVDGNDFYSTPSLSPDGKKLVWLTWNHPNMPWDASQIWVADVTADGTLSGARQVSGDKDESCFQPQWSPQGELYFISDRSGFWNFYRGDKAPLMVLKKDTDFGIPQWVFGMSTYDFMNDGRILCTYGEKGIGTLAFMDGERGTLSPIACQWQDFSSIRCGGGKAIFIGGSPTLMPAIVEMNALGDADSFKILRKSSPVELDPGYVSIAQPITFPTENGKEAYAFYYPPTNKDFVAPPGELPPLLVKSHGGPTSATSSTLSLGRQFWTSRGFAVVDVNYGGSTGFGREYRNRLYDSWGIVDVDDCANAAKYLAKQGKVDPKRMAIAGGSAGGYTTLCALTFRDVFTAGASYYGVSDLEALAKDTHKFESRYLDKLVGPYPKAKDIYVARSPINFAERIKCPVLFLQGLEDKVVPPSQSEAMVNALRKNGVPVSYIAFEGEQHGWRQASTIKRALDAELSFYGQIFKFKPADAVEQTNIENFHSTVGK